MDDESFERQEEQQKSQNGPTPNCTKTKDQESSIQETVLTSLI